MPRGAHLVGSVPLGSAEEVLSTAARIMGKHLRRLPDGETGARANWIACQLAVFEQVSELESEVVDIGYLKRAKFRLKKAASSAAFPALGYGAAALASYPVFRRLKQSGQIASDARFQVALPTPLAPIHAYVFRESQHALLPAYESRMRAELEQILEGVPAAELAVQWDTAIEFAVLEGVMPTFFEAPEAEILERLLAYGGWVPAGVELGYHLCYGDSGHKHFKEPADASWLVKVANALADRLPRALDWLHLPVPRERFDDAYYAPLRALKLDPRTELYLGLVHLSDGAEGTRRRIEAAARHVERFGVATECGFGRRPADSIVPLMQVHTAVSQPLGRS